MASYKTIEELVNHYIPFVNGSAKGWNVVYCEACGDGSRTKGPRGGWLFQDAMAFYHCFNCGVDASFDPEREHPRSKEFTRVASSFGIPLNDVKMLEFLHKGSSGKPSEAIKSKTTAIESMAIPNHFYLLSEADSDNEVASLAREFLIKSKKINPDSYKFYLSTGIADKTAEPRESVLTKGLSGKLIIPAFRGTNMIYYQARRLDGIEKNKYISCDKSRANIIYNMDRLYDDIKSPLFITEGFFDAHHLNGVSVMENKLTSQQTDLLNRSPRKKVVVPDYNGDSNKLVDQAIKNGWGISIPSFGSEIKDITEAIVKYGRLFVAHEVVKSIKYGDAAKIMAKMRNLL